RAVPPRRGGRQVARRARPARAPQAAAAAARLPAAGCGDLRSAGPRPGFCGGRFRRPARPRHHQHPIPGAVAGRRRRIRQRTVSVMVFDAPPATATHSWMPISPCGPGCVQAADTAGSARVAGRALRLAGLLASYPAAHVLTPARRREWLQREYDRGVLRSCGIELRVIDNRGADADGRARYAEPGTGVLVVAGHIGWSDVVVLAAVQPLSFVARADLIDWPMLGRLAELMRIIPIERERLRALPGVVAQIAERLAAGERVAAFPEGTT